MTLSNEAVTSFQRLYQSRCGILLSYKTAHDIALKELRRFAKIYRHIPVEHKGRSNKLHNK